MNDNTLKQPGEEQSMGAVLGSIIVIIILLVAAFYLWNNRQEPVVAPEDVETGVTADTVLQTPDTQTDSLQNQDTSDGLESIETDLNATDLNNVTEESTLIEQELNVQ